MDNRIAALKSKTIIFLVTNVLREILGESEKTDTIVESVLSDDAALKNIQELIPDFDRAFIMDIVAVLGANNDFCKELDSCSAKMIY